MHERIHIHTHTDTHIYIYITILDYIYMHTYTHAWHYIALHYVTLRYITLHYITLNYITLHRDTHDIAQPNDRTLFLVGRCFSITGCFFDLVISRDTYAWSRPCFRPATKRWWGSQRFLGSGARMSRRSANRDTRGIPGACPESSNGDLRYPLLGNLQYCFFLFQPFSTIFNSWIEGTHKTPTILVLPVISHEKSDSGRSLRQRKQYCIQAALFGLVLAVAASCER